MEADVTQPVLVIGIGNPDRGDDGAGIAVVRHLRTRMLSGISLIEHSGMGADLLDLWQTKSARTFYLIDAMVSGSPPGTIQRFEAHTGPLPAQFAGNDSTHAFGLIQAIELGRVLGYLPPAIIIYGIEGLCFEVSAPLSLEVAAAAIKTTELIVGEISDHRRTAKAKVWSETAAVKKRN